MSLIKLRKTVNEGLTEYRLFKSQYKEKLNTKKDLEQLSLEIIQAQEIVQSVAKTIQEEAHNQIASIVSQCLEIVFEEPYAFHILFEQKRNRTEARLVFERDSLQIDPMSAAGGGVVDVAAFALRLSCLMLSKPKLRRLLVLDEPFKFVSQEYRSNVREMLERLSEELQVQMVIITHINELVTGKEINL